MAEYFRFDRFLSSEKLAKLEVKYFPYQLLEQVALYTQKKN
jgi:hypothetical protein